jgi:hypothetical protein
MELLVLASQLIIGFGLLNVWILRPSKATAWRGGQAATMREEFDVYGLPGWFMTVIGFLKVTLALALIAGVWFPGITRPASLGIAALMLGAVAMHVRVKDRPMKSLPAFSLLVLALFVALY